MVQEARPSHNGLTTRTAKPKTKYEVDYCPTLVLEHPEFRTLAPGDPALENDDLNLACAYDEKHQIKMIIKPNPIAREGEAIVRVRATGICG